MDNFVLLVLFINIIVLILFIILNKNTIDNFFISILINLILYTLILFTSINILN